MSLGAPDGFDPAPLAPVDCHRACKPPNDELLVDNCFEMGAGEAGERCENARGGADPRLGVVCHARVLLHVGVIAKGLLCAHGGGLRRMVCLLASQQSSTKSMDGHQVCRSNLGTCRAPGKAQRARHVTCLFSLSLAFLFGRFKQPPSALHSHTLPCYVRNSNIPMMSLAVRPLRVGPPPVASSPTDAHPSSSIEKHYVLPPTCCADGPGPFPVHNIKSHTPAQILLCPQARYILYAPDHDT